MIYPSLNFDARLYLNDASGKPAAASFSRAGAGSLCNAIGRLATAASGAMRHDYAADGRYLGWLLEPQRSNLLTRSEDFSNADWQDFNATQSANAAAAPDGASSADKIVEAANTDSHGVYQACSFTAAAHCFSVYLKAAERSWALLQINDGSNHAAYFNLASGSLGSVGGGVTARCQAIGDGWYRCSVAYSTAAASGNVYVGPATGDGGNSYAGNGASGLLAWGAQLEAGTWPGGYIATTASQVTRPADSLSVATASFPFNPSEGSLLVHFDVAALGLLGGIARLHNASYGGIALYRGTGNLIALDINDGTPRGNVAASQPLVAGEPFRLAVAWKQGDGALCVNGGPLALLAPAAIPAALDTLELGGGGWGTGPLGGHLRHVAYFPRRLSNAELQDITRL